MPAPTPQGAATQRANGASTTYTGDAPGGIVSGELLVAHIRVNSASNLVTMSDLRGFSEQLNTSSASQVGGGAIFLTKIADSADVANAGVSAYYPFVGSWSAANIVAVFRIGGGLLTPDATGFNRYSTSTTPQVHPAITTDDVDRLLLFCADNGFNATWTYSGSGTELYDFAGGANRSLALWYETQASAGSSGTRNATPSTADTGSALSVGVSPPASGWSGRTAPDAILDMHNLVGSLTDIDEDPDSPDANWLVVG